MSISRGAFVKAAVATALVTPAIFSPRAGAGSVERKESNMEIKRIGSQPSSKGPAEWFTGSVRVDPLFEAPNPARVRGASVTFEPGARTAWHTHPLGQTLIVTVGCGRAQCEGGSVEEIHPGDVVWFPPNEKHWHGAAPQIAMTHIAIQEALDGKVVDWMEKVTDEQYNVGSRGTEQKKIMKNDSENFAGKVAFVTGGGSGIGRAAALAFARAGASVAVADVSKEANQETAA